MTDALVMVLKDGSFVAIDAVDAPLAQYNWSPGAYPQAATEHGVVYLHRAILERKLDRPIAKGLLCDHINGVTFDCRRSNLREVTHKENSSNLHVRKGVTASVRRRLRKERIATQTAIAGIQKASKFTFPHEYNVELEYCFQLFDTAQSADGKRKNALIELAYEQARKVWQMRVDIVYRAKQAARRGERRVTR